MFKRKVNIDYIIEGTYNSQHQGAVESFNKATTVSILRLNILELNEHWQILQEIFKSSKNYWFVNNC